MRKVCLTLLTAALTISFAMALGATLLGRDNAFRVKRAQKIVDELQRLEIGKSDRMIADSIAVKFGNAPPPGWSGGRYNKENCAAPDHLENCSYIMLINDSPVETLFLKHPLLPRLGAGEWWGMLRYLRRGRVESKTAL